MMSSSCLICSRMGHPGERGIFPDESLIYVDNPKLIRFICQELSINFEKIFNESSLNIPFCTECHKLYIALEQTKQQLDKVLSEIKDKIIRSPVDRRTPIADANSECEIFRKEIRRNFGGHVEDATNNVIQNHSQQQLSSDTLNLTESKIELVKTELEESDDYIDAVPETDIIPQIVSVRTLNSVSTPSTSVPFASLIQTGPPQQPRQVFLILAEPRITSTIQISRSRCDLCGPNDMRVYNKEELERHLKMIHNTVIISYTCPLSTCQKKFPLQALLQEHLQNFRHEGEQMKSVAKRKYLCDECEKSFSTNDYLQTHMQYHIRSVKTDKSKTCRFCRKKTTFPKILRDHEIEEHQDKLVHSCDQCHQKYSLPEILETHMNTHLEQEQYLCTICNTICKTAKNLELHLMEFHVPRSLKRYPDKKLTCQDCGKLFSHQDSLRIHKSKFHNSNSSVARISKISGKTVRNIYDHKKNHGSKVTTLKTKVTTTANLKRLDCYFCHKHFKRFTNLQTHMYIHLLERPFMCHICKAAFNQHHCLTNHFTKVHKKNGTYYSKPESPVEVYIDPNIEYINEIQPFQSDPLISLDFEIFDGLKTRV